MKEKPKAPTAGFNTRTTKIVSALAGKSNQQQTAAARAISNTVSNTASQPDLMLFQQLVEKCINIDTVGVVLDYSDADLPKTFAVVSDSDDVEPDSHRGWGRAESDFGAKTIRVECRKRRAKKGEPVTDRKKLLYIEGSPSYHYQGHNVASSDDLVMLTHDLVKAVHQSHPLNIPRPLRALLAQGRYGEVTRLDVAILVRVPDGVSKAALINAVALANVMAGANMSLYANESTYGDPSSQLRAWKLYDKALEIQRKGKQALPKTEAGKALAHLCEQTVRLEFVFRKKYFANHAYFKGKPVYPMRLTRETIAWMVIEELHRLQLKGKVHRRYGLNELLMIPMPYRSTLAHWQNKLKVRNFLESDQEAKRHWRYLKNRLGVDVFGEPPAEIELPISLLEVLHPNNFVPVPASIKADASVFHQSDMNAALQRQLSKMDRKARGVGLVWVDPYSDPLDEAA